MTAPTAAGQAGAMTGDPAEPGPARPPSLPDRVVRYGIWLAVMIRCLGDRRFQASVITGAIGAYALASVIKNNQARPTAAAASRRSRAAHRVDPHHPPVRAAWGTGWDRSCLLTVILRPASLRFHSGDVTDPARYRACTSWLQQCILWVLYIVATMRRYPRFISPVTHYGAMPVRLLGAMLRAQIPAHADERPGRRSAS